MLGAGPVRPMPTPHPTATLLAALFLCAAPSPAQQDQPIPGMPTSGGYTPPALSLESLLASDKTISDAVMAYAQSGDSATFRRAVQSAAASDDIAAELYLAEQYIPEQCPFDPNHDAPHCRPDGKPNPNVLFRSNPLDLPSSYEDACQWLERASAQGSGEASEILAQLITRMLSNGHPTPYTDADSTRLHALARITQGFHVEPISVSCYQLTPNSKDSGALTLAVPPRRLLTASDGAAQPFSNDELQALQTAGAHGALRFQSETSGGESILLSRPAGPPAHIRIILDHNPEHEIHLSIPANQDVIYLQHGETFLAFPPDISTLPRFLSITPQHETMQQVSIYVQQISGAFSGNLCARF